MDVVVPQFNKLDDFDTFKSKISGLVDYFNGDGLADLAENWGDIRQLLNNIPSDQDIVNGMRGSAVFEQLVARNNSQLGGNSGIHLNFIEQNYTKRGSDGIETGDILDAITLTRSSRATYFDSNGVFQVAENDVARFDHDPSTLQPIGIRVENASTNLIRNPRGEGAVAGTPGTPPTYWAIENGGGTSREIVGFGVEDGIDYIDVRFFGTVASATALVIRSEPQNYITAAVGETFTASAFVRLVGGSLAGVPTAAMWVWEALPNGNPNGQTGTAFTPTGAPLRTQRYRHTRTMANAGTERVFQQVRLTPATGATIDITLRVGFPQMEKLPYPTSVILPPVGTLAQSTRATDNCYLATSSFPYNNQGGTVIVDFNPVAPVFSADRGIFVIERTSSLAYSALATLRLAGTDVFTRVAGADGIGSTSFYAPGSHNRYKVAVAWRVGRSRVGVNGTLVTTTLPSPTETDMPTDPVWFRIGSSRGGTNKLGGTISSASYVTRDLTDDEIQQETTI